MAKIRANRFRLFAQGCKHVRNSFVPFFYGRVEESRDGPRIIGSFKMHLFVRTFLLIWFGGVMAIAIGFPLTVQGVKAPLIFIVGASLMTSLGAGLVHFGRWLSRGQMSRLREFIREELKATLITR